MVSLNKKICWGVVLEVFSFGSLLIFIWKCFFECFCCFARGFFFGVCRCLLVWEGIFGYFWCFFMFLGVGLLLVCVCVFLLGFCGVSVGASLLD